MPVSGLEKFTHVFSCKLDKRPNTDKIKNFKKEEKKKKKKAFTV